MKATVRATTITFESPSRELMSCAAALGADGKYVVGLGLEPLEAETIRLREIDGVDTFEKVGEARTAARSRIEVRCSGSTLRIVTLTP